MNREALPPLLRGLGTLLILVVSALVIVVERQEQRQLSQAFVRAEAHAVPAAKNDLRDPRLAARVPDARPLRPGDDDLADRVFENTSFQLLGLLGTALLAASFFVEAWHKRRRASGAEDSSGAEP